MRVERTSGDALFHIPAQSRVNYSRLLRTTSSQSWLSPKMETLQPPWATCSSNWPLSQLKKKGFPSSNGISICVCCLLSFHWAPVRRASLSSLFPQLFIHIDEIHPWALSSLGWIAPALSPSPKPVSNPFLSFVALHCTPVCQCLSCTEDSKYGLTRVEEKDLLPQSANNAVTNSVYCWLPSLQKTLAGFCSICCPPKPPCPFLQSCFPASRSTAYTGEWGHSTPGAGLDLFIKLHCGPFPNLLMSLCIVPSFAEVKQWPMIQVMNEDVKQYLLAPSRSQNRPKSASWKAFSTMLSCRYCLIYLHMLKVGRFLPILNHETKRARYGERSKKHQLQDTRLIHVQIKLDDSTHGFA